MASASVNATQERWRPVPGYEGRYEVSDQGRVRSLTRTVVSNVHGGMRLVEGRILKPWNQARGYKWATLGGRKDRFAVHRLVLLAFEGPNPPGKPIIRHLNDEKSDNRLVNLSYGTYSENSYDIVANGNHVQANRTHCIRGHEFTPENIVWQNSGRECRRCMYDRIRKYQQEKSRKSAELGMKVRPNTTDEKWLPVVGYEGLYEVSDQGRVRSLDRVIVCRNGVTKPKKGRILSPGRRGGYPQVNLARGGGDFRMFDIHSLVLAAFVGPRPEGQVTRHLNDNPIDNWLENLAYGTHQQNAEDRIQNQLTKE